MQRFLASLRLLFGQRDFTALLFCNFLVSLGYAFVAPFMSMFGTLEVEMSSLVFGVFMTVTSLAAVVISTGLARWSDTRVSRKTMLLLGGISGALGYLGYAFVRDVIGLILIGSFLLGIASVTFSQLFAQARDLLEKNATEPQEVPFYMNIFRLFFALPWTVGPAWAAQIMLRYSYQGTFLVAASFFALFVIVVSCFVEGVPPSQASREAAAALPLRVAFRNPKLLAHFIGFVLFFSCSTMGMMNLPLLVLNTLGGHEGQVGIAYSVAPLFELPFMYYLGVLATRGDSARLIRGALGLAVIYYGFLSVVGAPWQVYPLQILSAAIVAVTSGIAISFFQNFLPNQAGTATNVYSNASRLGATLGYLLFGFLASGFGHRVVFVVCALLSSCALSLLILYRESPARPAL